MITCIVCNGCWHCVANIPYAPTTDIQAVWACSPDDWIQMGLAFISTPSEGGVPDETRAIVGETGKLQLLGRGHTQKQLSHLLDASRGPLHSLLGIEDSMGEKERERTDSALSRCFFLVHYQRLLRWIRRQKIWLVTEISKMYLQVAAHGCRKDPITKSIY